jgi:hypothetical protein
MDETPIQNSPCCRTVNRDDPEQQEISQIIRSWNITKDPTSIINLGKDGVLRNLSGDREVLDAVGLRPSLIEAFLSRLPEDWRQGYDGLDGSKIPKELWYKPNNPEALFPPPLSKEKQEASRKRFHEFKTREQQAKENANSPLLTKEQQQDALKKFEEWKSERREKATEESLKHMSEEERQEARRKIAEWEETRAQKAKQQAEG